MPQLKNKAKVLPPPIPKSIERRQSNRLRTRLRVDYYPHISQGDHFVIGHSHRGLTMDISQSGLFLGEVGYFPLNTVVHLVLRLPDIPANPLICFAKVVRREINRRTGYGLRFIRMKQADSERIGRFISTILKSRVRWPR